MPWRGQYTDEAHCPFIVDDGTGTAYVDPEDAELMLKDGDEFTVEPGEEPPPRIREFLERETNVTPVDSKRRRKYTETRIGIGDDVLVTGQTDPDAVSDLEQSVTTVIAARGDAPRFYITDDLDSGVGGRLAREAFGSFLAAAILLGIAFFMLL